MNTKSQKVKSPTVRSRILLTASLLSLVRLGCFIPVPNLDREIFLSLLESEGLGTNPVTQVLNTFSGVGNDSFGLLSLGILPYINASIIVQLLSTIIPSLSKLQKEEGEYGRRLLTDYTRYLTLFWAIIESIAIMNNMKGFLFNWNFWIALQISITMVTGSMIVLWFSELISRKGLGNGSSLLICFNIASSLPDQIKTFIISLQEKTLVNNLNYSTVSFLLIGFFLLTTLGCIYINEGLISIPLVSARQLLKKSKTNIETKNALPLRLNQAGVMPLVFTSYSMVLLSFFANFIKIKGNLAGISNILPFFNNFNFYWGGRFVYWGIYAGLIYFFTYFYSTIVLDPKDVAAQFEKNSVVILGIEPGYPTRNYLNQTLKRIAGINAIFLISNIVVLQLVEALFNLNITSLRGLGFTSQLILVNVLIDTIKRSRSFLKQEENTF